MSIVYLLSQNKLLTCLIYKFNNDDNNNKDQYKCQW